MTPRRDAPADAPGTLLAPAVPLPALPPRVPTRRYAWWLVALGRLVLGGLGWRWTGGFPDRDRLVLVAAPHTSNGDGLVGLAAVAVLGLDLGFFAKRQLFWPPLGGVLRRLGVEPVDRDAPGGRVGQAVARFARGGPLLVGVTPEGTRQRAPRWRTGFHRIAVEAGVPVAVAGIDWRRRQIGIVGTLAPTGDLAADLAAIERLLAGVEGRHPERATAATDGVAPA